MGQWCQTEWILTMLTTKQNVATGLDCCCACFVLLLVFALNPQEHSIVNRQLEFFNCGPGSVVGFTGTGV